jgi:hypothetical protein
LAAGRLVLIGEPGFARGEVLIPDCKAHLKGGVI